METLTSIEAIDKVIEKDFVMIIAKTHTCNTCKQINEHLKNTIHRLDDIEHYQVFIDDVDQFRGSHVIFSVPTVLIFSNNKEMLRESRFVNTQKINRLIDNYLD